MRDSFIRRTVSRLSNWFPVALLASLAMLTYWLDAQVQGGGRGARPAKQDPDYFLEDFAATRFGADGSVIQQLTAKKMVHYPDGLPTQVEGPQLTVTAPGKAPMRARADSARISPDNEHIYLTGNVVAERDAKSGKDQLLLTTDYLHVQPKLERADTDRRVTITNASGRHVGGAMESDNKAHTLKLRNGATGELSPRPR